MAEIERLQHVEADLHLLYGIRRQRYPNGVADPRPEQHPQSDRRFHGADAEAAGLGDAEMERSEEHTSELQSLMRISYAVFCLKQKKQNRRNTRHKHESKTQTTE